MGNIMNIYRTLYAPLKKVQDFSQFYKLNHMSLKREAIAPFPRAYERLLQSSESQISFHKSNEFFSKIKNYREKKKKSLSLKIILTSLCGRAFQKIQAPMDCCCPEHANGLNRDYYAQSAKNLYSDQKHQLS